MHLRFATNIGALSAAMILSPTVVSAACPFIFEGGLAFKSCGGHCRQTPACMAPGSDSIIANDPLYFLISFDSATGVALKSGSPPGFELFGSGLDDTKTYPSWNGSMVTKIYQLDTVSSTVSIQGGSTFNAGRKGVLSNVEIVEEILEGNPQVTSFTLTNVNLNAHTNGTNFLANLPTNIKTLQLTNVALTAFPSAVTKYSALQNLHLPYNNIEQVTADHSMPGLLALSVNVSQLSLFSAEYPKLTYLDLGFNLLESLPASLQTHSQLRTLKLSSNNITVFNASIPNLARLHLENNKLREFPAAIFTHANLAALHLGGNTNMRNIAFTNEQANYLSYLDEFTISNTSLLTTCAEDQKYTFERLAVTVCISGGLKLDTIHSSPRIISSTTAIKSSSTSTVPIAIGASAAVIVVVIVVLLVWRRRRSRAKNSNDGSNTGASGTATNGTGNTAHGGGTSLWTDQELLSLAVRAEDIQDIKKIGSGAFAEVWLVKFRGSQLMASKRLRAGDATRAQTQAFVDEIKLVATLQHPSIVAFMGAAWVRESDLQALFEYMDSGDLRNFLTATAASPKWTAEKLQIAIDIAEALVYVHSFLPPLVHRDLKSRNVLLNADMRAKLTDFGVSRFRSVDNTMTAGVGTGRWLAPEVIMGDSNYGPAADVFSFGVLLSELDTHQIPYSDARGGGMNHNNPLPDVAVLQLVSCGSLTPTLSAGCPEKISELARRCYALAPSERPSAPEIAYALRSLQKAGLFAS